MDRLSAQVHRPVLVGLGAPARVVKKVQLFAALVGSWCLLELFAWFELWWLLAGGHRHLLVERPRLLPMHQFVAAKQM